MTDIAALQSEILAAVAGAADEAALEAVRVAALGKKGSVSALLATMGGLSPDERKIQGPAIQRPEGRGHRRHRRAQSRSWATRRWKRGWPRKSWTSPCPRAARK